MSNQRTGNKTVIEDHETIAIALQSHMATTTKDAEMLKVQMEQWIDFQLQPRTLDYVLDGITASDYFAFKNAMHDLWDSSRKVLGVLEDLERKTSKRS